MTTEYYIKAFRLLEEEKRHTWNWSAFFFGSLWMLYRKMYLYGILGNIILFLYITFVNSYLKLSSETENVLYACCFFNLFYFALSICYGYFANSLYYRVVSNRIENGYHLLKKYSPISISTALPEVLLSSLFVCFSTILFALANFCQKPEKSKLTEENTAINEESMTMYLKSEKSYSFSTFFFFLFLLVLGLGTPLGNLQLILDSFEPISDYEEFEAERSTLLKTEKDLKNKELNKAILTILAPDIFEEMYLSADNGNEFAKNRLKSFQSTFLTYSKKLNSGDEFTEKIRETSFRILDILKKLITTQRNDVVCYMVKSGYDLNYISSATDKVLKIDAETWEKSMLLMMDIARFNKKSETYLKLSKEGNAEAQSKLGRYYIKGFAVSSRGINFNGEEGLMWLKKASEQNDKTWSGYASARIAFVYMNGEAGISQNYKEANKWFEKAIEQGYYPALYELALNYYEGVGVEKNVEKATQLLKCAIEKGDKRAKELFDSITAHNRTKN